MFHTVRKVRAQNEFTHNLVRKIFWRHFDTDLTLNLRSRKRTNYISVGVRVTPTIALQRPMDLMRNLFNGAHVFHKMLGPALPFYSRFE